ncbi:hypothetical protein CMEL01_16391 [Colletotrichum melonis]|uniref:G domain-containing protein n=1 Tax=Colletotrichum melonis TaxID=1209925 RepID=A0AAI9UDS1_9PEZI|nr:hypothetical protein CMEL01_16391 [Colletotrichum melonis]
MNQELQRNLAVQAWFWMVSESKMLGLKFGSAELAGDRASLMDPILLRILEGHGNPWSCTTDNGIRFEMADIQMLHEDERYSVRHGLAKPKGGVQKERIRTPFDKGGGLQSYSSEPQGTTIHPSVYLLLDRYIGIGLDMQKFPFYDNLEKWRYKILGQDVDFPNQGFWNDAAIQDYKDFGPLRILVCGNTGVGKSSLINKVFGVPDSEEVTKSSNNVRGEHNVQDELTWPGRPDLVIHDSRGFEAAATAELQAVREFLRKKQRNTEINKRLHAIWFCLEVNNQRPVQEATQELFRIIAEYAKDIPVIVIATKKDDFEKIHFSDGVMSALAQGQTPDYENLAQFARDQVNRRLRDLEKLIMNLDGGRFDVCVAVSKDDDKSIQSLVARLDLKVDLALESVMAIYRNVVRRSTLTAGLPAATPMNRKSAAIKLCEAIISCFGIPGVDGKTAFDVYGRNIFDKEGNSIATATAEAIAAVSAITTGIFLGIPFILISAGSNVPLVVPTTARLILMLACDLILMFSRGFQEASGKCNTQPQLADLEKAAAAYQAHSPRVHKKVKSLVPGVSMCFRMDKIKLGIKEILQDSRQFFAGDNAAPPATPRHSSDSWNELASLQDTIAEDIATIEQTGEDIVRQADRSDSASLFRMQSMKTVVREFMEVRPVLGQVSSAKARRDAIVAESNPRDSYASLSSKCSRTGVDVLKYRAKPSLRPTFKPGEYVCCFAGISYEETKSERPQSNARQSCVTGVIKDHQAALGTLPGRHVVRCRYAPILDSVLGLPLDEEIDISHRQAKGLRRILVPRHGLVQVGTHDGPRPHLRCAATRTSAKPATMHCNIQAPILGGSGTKLSETASACIPKCGVWIKQTLSRQPYSPASFVKSRGTSAASASGPGERQY